MKLNQISTAILSGIFIFSFFSVASAEEEVLEKTQFAKLYSDQEKIPDGDLIKLQRHIGNWNLKCSISAAKKRRICQTEQYIQQDDDWIEWSIGVAINGKTYVVINAPTDIDVNDGIRISFSGLEKNLKNITCDNVNCTTSFVLEGFVQSAIMSSETISFFYKKGNNAKTLSNKMAGLLYAIDAAGSNPLASIMDEDKAPDNSALQDKKQNNKKIKNNK